MKTDSKKISIINLELKEEEAVAVIGAINNTIQLIETLDPALEPPEVLLELRNTLDDEVDWIEEW